MFEPADKLLFGFLTGVVFGFLLQKGRAAKYRTIMGQFLLSDFTVVKIMGTAITVGAVGIYFMQSFDLIHLEIKPAAFGSVVAGAILFGVGIAIFGLCPGTSVAACGEGNRHAMVGVAGMFVGAAAYVLLFPTLQDLSRLNWGKVTIPQLTNTSPWLWVGILVLAALALYSTERLANSKRPGRDQFA